jgi:hypothetical protein
VSIAETLLRVPTPRPVKTSGDSFAHRQRLAAYSLA